MLVYNEEIAKVEHLRDSPKIGLEEKPAAVAYDTIDDVPLAWRREGGIFSRCRRDLATGAINPIVAIVDDAARS
jgi:hypothetical protein